MAKKSKQPPAKPFDYTTQGLGRNEMERRTKQHNILATKKYESYKALNLGIDAKWVNKNVQGNEMNPWVMKTIGQMVGQQDKANKQMRDALKMWGIASKFEQTKGSQTPYKSSNLKLDRFAKKMKQMKKLEN